MPVIEGITCSEEMARELSELPCSTYRRIEAALRLAFAAPERVEEYANLPYEEMEFHLIVSEGVLFLLGDNRARVELLRVLLFHSDGSPRTLH